MQDIILNVVYDTDTAMAFGTRESTGDRSDDGWYKETLYRNQSGYWFIAGQGGSRSRFATEDQSGHRKAAAGIIPVGRMQAMHWLAEIGHVGALRDFFKDETEFLANEYQLNL